MPALTDYVTLGNSGLRVSPLCMGAMTFGTEGGFGVGDADSYKLIAHYIDAGGNFIDTANIYQKGASEQIHGDYFKKKGGGKFPARDRTVLATKWLGNMYRNDPNGGGSHRKAMMEPVDQSLRRLQTDYIDLLWLHFWDRHTPIEETMRGLDDLVSSGKVLYIGFSDTPAWKVAQAQMIAHFRATTVDAIIAGLTQTAVVEPGDADEPAALDASPDSPLALLPSVSFASSGSGADSPSSVAFVDALFVVFGSGLR